jgi:uncharacterized repeat protein (TIGR01451 family)
MKKKHLAVMITGALLGLALVLVALQPGPARAATPSSWTVCPAGPPLCDFSTIQGAVNAAGAGDVVKVAAGRYTDLHSAGVERNVVLLRKTITIRGGYAAPDFAEPPDPLAYPTTVDAQGMGRGLYIDSGISATIEGLSITGGSVYEGGGVLAWKTTAYLANNHIYGNTASLGGGLSVFGGDSVVLRGNVIEGNRATGQNSFLGGGGVHISDASILLQENVIISNTARYGGGLYDWKGDLRLVQNHIAGNRADIGAGLWLWISHTRLTNNLIAHNESGVEGSGLYVRGGSIRLWHNTLARNSGGDGSGIHLAIDPLFPFTATVALTNTILVSHTVGIYVAEGNSARLEATLWGGGAWANRRDWGGTGTVVTGTFNLWTDPGFLCVTDACAAPFRLGPGSAAADQGIDQGVMDDIDGESRPIGPGYDIGADEAGLIIVKGVTPERVSLGALLTYTLRMTNTSNVDLNATITDVLPAHVRPGGPLVWTPVVSSSGTGWSETLVVTVETGYLGRFTNLVRATTLEGARGTARATAIAIGRLYYLPLVLKGRA